VKLALQVDGGLVAGNGLLAMLRPKEPAPQQHEQRTQGQAEAGQQQSGSRLLFSLLPLYKVSKRQTQSDSALLLATTSFPTLCKHPGGGGGAPPNRCIVTICKS